MKSSENAIAVNDKYFFNKSDSKHIGLIYVKKIIDYNIHVLLIAGYKHTFFDHDYYSAISINDGRYFYKDLSYDQLIERLDRDGYKPLQDNSVVTINIDRQRGDTDVEQVWAASPPGIKFRRLIKQIYNNDINISTNIIAADCKINRSVIKKWLNGGNPSMTFLTKVVNAINNRLNNPESTRISHEIIEETKRYKNDQRKQKV